LFNGIGDALILAGDLVVLLARAKEVTNEREYD
jgi:hypothetical protein